MPAVAGDEVAVIGGMFVAEHRLAMWVGGTKVRKADGRAGVDVAYVVDGWGSLGAV